MSWWQTFADKDRPVHKSDLISFARCPRKLRYSVEAEMGKGADEEVFGLALTGTAVHATLERALPFVIDGGLLDPTKLRLAYHQEFKKALEAEEVSLDKVRWPRDQSVDSIHKEMVAELYYFLAVANKKVCKVIGVEKKFSAVIKRGNAEIHTAGTIDIIFETHEAKLAVGDYKSGKRRPTQLVLDVGYEMATYAHAIAEGDFEGSDGNTMRYGRFPDEIYQINVRDFMPAQKDSNRKIWLKAECEFFGVKPGTTVKIKEGAQRGPGWYRSYRTEDQTPSFVEAVGNAVSTIRMGRFFPVLNDQCVGCRFKGPCLAEGFGLKSDDKRKLESILNSIPPELLDKDEDVG